MRMWNVNARKMCRNHLLGEHVECHMFFSNIKNKKNISGYLKNGLIETHNLKKRHNILSKELLRRGYKHKSPLAFFKAKKQKNK